MKTTNSNYRVLFFSIILSLILATKYNYDKLRFPQYNQGEIVILSEKYYIHDMTFRITYNIGIVLSGDAKVKFNKDIIYDVDRIWCLQFGNHYDYYMGRTVSVIETEIKERFSFENPKHMNLLPNQRVRDELMKHKSMIEEGYYDKR